MRKIYFHEDDYCQLEVLPLAARQFCLQEMGEIDAFAEEHREGPFYTDMYLREESPETLLQLNLRPEQLAEALAFLPASSTDQNTANSSFNPLACVLWHSSR